MSDIVNRFPLAVRPVSELGLSYNVYDGPLRIGVVTVSEDYKVAMVRGDPRELTDRNEEIVQAVIRHKAIKGAVRGGL